MAVVAALDVVLGAQTKRFNTGFKKSETTLGRFQKKFSDLTTFLRTTPKSFLLAAGAVGGITAAAVAAGFAIKKLLDRFDALDRIGKTSALLNINVQELINLRLAAAKFSGIASQQFDIALQRMTRRLGTALAQFRKTGEVTGEVGKSLNRLGLDITKIGTLTADKQFLAVADAIGKVESNSEQLAIVVSLVDSEGAKLLNTIRQGSSAIVSQSKVLRDFGLNLDREGIGKVEEFNDRMTDFKAVLGAVVDVAAVEFARQLVLIGEDFRSIGIEAVDLGNAIRNLFSFIAFKIRLPLRLIAAMRDIIESITTSIDGFLEKLREFNSRFPQLPNLQNALDDIAEAITFGTITPRRNRGAQGEDQALLKKQNDKTDLTNRLLRDVNRSLQDRPIVAAVL